jgi:hypothetical protein
MVDKSNTHQPKGVVRSCKLQLVVNALCARVMFTYQHVKAHLSIHAIIQAKLKANALLLYVRLFPQVLACEFLQLVKACFSPLPTLQVLAKKCVALILSLYLGKQHVPAFLQLQRLLVDTRAADDEDFIDVCLRGVKLRKSIGDTGYDQRAAFAACVDAGSCERNASTLRVTTTFTRPFSGRNFGGMLSHVLRPMTTAFTLRCCVAISPTPSPCAIECGDVRLVTRAK